jgi:Type II secretion system (T2SS), protein G
VAVDETWLLMFLPAGLLLVAVIRLAGRRQTDPDAAKLWRALVHGMAAIGLLVAPLAIFWLLPAGDSDRVSRVKMDLKTLTKAVHAFNDSAGKYPVTLDELTNPPDGKPFVETDALVDPWGRPYDYDPRGPRNHGKQPDIWTATLDGELIGNWMLK